MLTQSVVLVTDIHTHAAHTAVRYPVVTCITKGEVWQEF